MQVVCDQMELACVQPDRITARRAAATACRCVGPTTAGVTGAALPPA
jgi:hypothetical protein